MFSTNQIIECVPNFSEGKNELIINRIAKKISDINDVKLLHIDSGKNTNRTVITFVGSPEAIAEAAFAAIKTAAELIDMRLHRGEHPRIGATDVCPLIPVANISMQEVIACAQQLAHRVGEELGIPVYLYEEAATVSERKNLAFIRSGGYEGLEAKLADARWQPDFGPAMFNAKAGATVIGARDFLIAFNINLNTSSVKIANAIACDIREIGRTKTENGKIILDENGQPLRIPGTLKNVKAIGWYIEEYQCAQVSLNLTNINITPLHIAFDECCKKAAARGALVTGSELIGLVPLKCLLDAGKYYLQKENQNANLSEEKLISVAVNWLGLNAVKPFDPQKKIIEYVMNEG